MTPEFISIVHRALGSEFHRLHPKIREQYGISSQSNAAYVGSGIMDEIWHGRWFIIPFLYIGSSRRILFPETGCNVPFEIRNYAYLDKFERETVTWKRTFSFPSRTREFDEFFVFSDSRKTPILYAGTHQHLAIDIRFSVDDDGSLVVTTGDQRLFLGPITIPFPRFLSGDSVVRESFNEQANRFEVEVSIANRFLGDILCYRGSFNLERLACSHDQIPPGTIPVYENNRE